MDHQFRLGLDKAVPMPFGTIMIFYNANSLDLITEEWASDVGFKAEFRYLFIQKQPESRR